ncbi:MAG: NAD(P)-dependent glycerol-3-phosphate dehydrogenase [Treponemataceae bacterium]|nr:NAD(P)-dependent glycerol-3-phosphate dehydrogenase [Treponemataceae bacterium]
MEKTVGVIGAGAWGTAMAHALCRNGHKVEIYARGQKEVDAINECHENKKYLPGLPLNPNLKASTDIKQVASDKEFLILATPSLYLASTVEQILDIPSIKDGSTCIGVLTKGFIPTAQGPKLIIEMLESVLPEVYRGCITYIAGPSHAEEVAMGKLTALISACENPKNSIRYRELLKGPGLMVYSSFDTVGVQVCGAAKNVIAVFYGCLDAIADSSDIFGDNTESFVLAAGLNEIQTLGFAMGATHAETFTSISGVGDLDVTCRSKYGRNRRFGRDIINNNILDKFKDIDDLINRIDEVGYLPEGAVACKYIHQIAEEKKLRLPICNALYATLNHDKDPEQILRELLK